MSDLNLDAGGESQPNPLQCDGLLHTTLDVQSSALPPAESKSSDHTSFGPDGCAQDVDRFCDAAPAKRQRVSYSSDQNAMDSSVTVTVFDIRSDPDAGPAVEPPAEPESKKGEETSSSQSAATTVDAATTAANRRLLHLLSKDVLIDLVVTAVAAHSDIAAAVDKALEARSTCRRLMIRNVSFATENSAFHQTFSRFGPIEDYTIVRDKETKRSKGFGFVTFKTMTSVRTALTSPITLDGRELQIKLAAGDVGDGDPLAQSQPSKLITSPHLGLKRASHADSIAHQAPSVNDLSYGGTGQRKLFVRNLSRTTTTEHLRASFQEFGDIDDCIVITDHAQNRSKGYGFVTFARARDAARAIQTPHRFIEGQLAYIAYASGETGSRPLLHTPKPLPLQQYETSYSATPPYTQLVMPPTAAVSHPSTASTVKKTLATPAIYPFPPAPKPPPLCTAPQPQYNSSLLQPWVTFALQGCPPPPASPPLSSGPSSNRAASLVKATAESSAAALNGYRPPIALSQAVTRTTTHPQGPSAVLYSYSQPVLMPPVFYTA